MAIEWDMDVDRTGMEIASGYATAIEMHTPRSCGEFEMPMKMNTFYS